MAGAGATCAGCGGTVGWPCPSSCPRCGLQLSGPDAQRLAEVDRALMALGREREELLTRLRPATVPQVPEPPGDDGARAPARALAPAPVRAAAPAPPPARTGPRLSETSAQTLLAAAGVALLVAAAAVFAAVTWQDLGAWPRALILLAVTAGAAASARALARRGLTNTGEALAVLTVAFGLICVHAAHAFDLGGLGAVAADRYVAVTYVVVVAAAHALAAWSGTRAPRVLAGPLATVPGPAAVIHLGDVLPFDFVLVGAVGFFAVAMPTLAYARALARPGVARGLATAGAVLMWGAGGSATLFVLTEPALAVGGPLIVAIAAAAAATSMFGGAWRWAGPAGASLALTSAAVVTLWTAGLQLGLAAAVVATAAAAALTVVPAGRPRLGALGGATVVGLVTVARALDVIGVLLEEGLRVLASPWGGAGASSLTWEEVAVVALAGVAVGVALAAVRRRSAAVASGGAGLAAAAAGAVQVGGLDPRAHVLLGLLVAGALAATVAWRGSRLLLVAAAVPAAWALVWALAGRATTITALVVLAGIAALPAMRTVVTRRSRIVAAGVGAACAVAVAPTAVAAAGSAGTTAGIVAVAVAAAVVLAVDAAVATRRGGLLVGVEITGALAAGVGLVLAAADTRSLAVGFAVAGVAAGAHALRPDRRWSSVLSSALLSACSWTLLADASVAVVEAYTALPAAAALLLGAWRLHAQPAAGSWSTLGAGLALALTPTTMLVLADADDLPRVLALATLAAATAAAGALLRLATPVVYGVGALVVVALTQLGVAATHLPRWVTFAVLGVALVTFSATYERQLRRLDTARQRLALLR